MKTLFRRVTGLLLTMSLVLPVSAFAAGGGGAPVIIVADTRKLSGIMAWWANLYNESHIQFTILTVILIPVIGVIFGVLTDLAMHAIGIDLKSKDIGGH